MNWCRQHKILNHKNDRDNLSGRLAFHLECPVLCINVLFISFNCIFSTWMYFEKICFRYFYCSSISMGDFHFYLFDDIFPFTQVEADQENGASMDKRFSSGVVCDTGKLKSWAVRKCCEEDLSNRMKKKQILTGWWSIIKVLMGTRNDGYRELTLRNALRWHCFYPALRRWTAPWRWPWGTATPTASGWMEEQMPSLPTSFSLSGIHYKSERHKEEEEHIKE